MSDKLACILIALGVSIIANRLLAIYTFKVIDGYVKELFEITKESIKDAYADKERLRDVKEVGEKR